MARVLVVLPFYGGSLPVGRYCVEALRELGHLVDVFEAPEFFPAFEAVKGLKIRPERLEFLENGYLNLVGEAVLAQVERFQPDLVLAMAQAPLSRKVLQRLRKDGVATAMWFVEDYRLFVYWRAFAPFYDIFAVIQKEPFLSELAGIGVENALYLPMAAQPTVHKPLNLDAAERHRFGAALSFMGAGYPNRRRAFKELKPYGLKFWGTEWEDEPELAPCWQLPGQRISSADAVKIFNAAAINLNLHSSVQAEELVGQGDFVNPRTFEIAACGAFQLVDRRALLPELFAPDELATFSSMEELKAAITHYQAAPEQRAEIARKGRERVLKEHTYAARMEKLLAFTAERLPDWPPSQAGPSWLSELPQDFPEDLRQGLAELIQDLQLPADMDFPTLIAALRTRSTPLSALESALLFLDEWRKQYS